MTNLKHWQHYFKHIHAPLQFIEAGFYFTISAALERRVWVSSGAHRIFANQYVLLCGPAGVGKGLVTGVVDEVLRHNKRSQAADAEPIIRFGPSSGSYQKLAARMAAEATALTYVDNGVSRAYSYSSACCILDEFTSMFTEQAAEAMTFFCSVWAGNMPYERDTHTRGRVFLINPSLSMIAGTTPSNFQTLQKLNIIGSGLDRRLLIVFAPQNEWRQFEIPPTSGEQQASLDCIKQHVLHLTKVCGALKYDDDASARFATWWADTNQCEVSAHPKLRDYHPNKNSLVHKLCIAIHMAEGNPMTQMSKPISLETAEEAIRMLTSYEKFRHGAWSETAANAQYTLAMRIWEWLGRYGQQPLASIINSFFVEGDRIQIDQALNYLLISGRVTSNGLTYTQVKEHNG